MIRTENINGSPKKIPNPHPCCGCHVDNENFYFFETKEEKENFYSSMPKQNIVKDIDIAELLRKINLGEATDEEINMVAEYIK